MNGRQFSFGASGNPLVQILSLVVFGLVAVAAVIMGAFVLLAFVGLAFIGFIVFAVRGWWLRRKLRGRGAPYGPGGESPEGRSQEHRLIDAEYVVVEPDDDDERRRRGQR